MHSARWHDYQAIDALLVQLADRPVLTIFGARNDPLRFEPQWQDRFADTGQVTVPKGNHFPMCDDPALVAREMAAWHAQPVALQP